MADENAPNSASEKTKAEGERWSPEQAGSVSKAGKDVSQRYDETDESGGGITNRPLDEEVANQEALPERGHTKDEERGGGNRGGGAKQ